jgi:CopG family transcriptional regulator/antitoxin EndoAI
MAHHLGVHEVHGVQRASAGFARFASPGSPGASFDVHIPGVYSQIMTRSTSTFHRRLNITLPEKTVRLIDRVAKKGDRSSFIAEAVERYVAEIGRANLRKQLKEGAIRRAERDLNVTGEWFGIDEETWHGSRR